MFTYLINSEDISRLFDSLHYNLPLLLKENKAFKTKIDEKNKIIDTL